MTYRIVYGLLTHLRQQKTMDIKLPVPVTNAKTIRDFSTSHKLHRKDDFINYVTFSASDSGLYRT